MDFRCRFLLLLGLLMALAACATSSSSVPVLERTTQQLKRPQFHIVKRGDTLYSIAWRYGIDFKGLASANSIKAPFMISPGQKLHLKRIAKPKISVASGSKTKQASPVSASQSVLQKSLKSITNRLPASIKSDNDSWLWPSRGKLIGRFSTGGRRNKGIDIGGNLGEAVHCARSGKVVYAGTGLTGYGKLIIVKHNQEFLSAYAHSRKILVKEGDTVRAGQKIAEMGASGTSQVMLHFEIRQDGKPVNPLKFLPGKRPI